MLEVILGQDEHSSSLAQQPPLPSCGQTSRGECKVLLETRANCAREQRALGMRRETGDWTPGHPPSVTLMSTCVLPQRAQPEYSHCALERSQQRGAWEQRRHVGQRAEV